MNYEQRKSLINSVNDGNSVNGEPPESEKPVDRACDVCGEYYDYYRSVENRVCQDCIDCKAVDIYAQPK